MERNNVRSDGVDITVFGHTVHFTDDDVEALLYTSVLDVFQEHPEWTVEQVTHALVNAGWGAYDMVLEVVVFAAQSSGMCG